MPFFSLVKQNGIFLHSSLHKSCETHFLKCDDYFFLYLQLKNLFKKVVLLCKKTYFVVGQYHYQSFASCIYNEENQSVFLFDWKQKSSKVEKVSLDNTVNIHSSFPVLTQKVWQSKWPLGWVQTHKINIYSIYQTSFSVCYGKTI